MVIVMTTRGRLAIGNVLTYETSNGQSHLRPCDVD